MATIENWTFRTTNPYVAPEMARIEVTGETQNHPNFPDGSKVTTEAVALTPAGFTSYSGREWRLGGPDTQTTRKEFEARFLEIAEGRLKAGYPLGSPR